MEETTQKVSGWKSVANNFPALEGSEKQIAWAEDIRNGHIDTLDIVKKVLLEEGIYANTTMEVGRIAGFESDEYYNRNLKKDQIRKIENMIDSLHPTDKTEENFDPDYGFYGGYPGYVERKRREIDSQTKERLMKVDKSNKTDRAKIRNDGKKKFNEWFYNEYEKAIRSNKSAKWWIDHRNQFVKKQ